MTWYDPSYSEIDVLTVVFQVVAEPRFTVGSLHSGLWTRGALVGFSWQRSQARQARRKLFVLTIKAPPLGTGWYVDRVVSLPVHSSICLLNLI
ncbi:hypothetical protein HCEG_05930 [Histoplasma capsulatum var. duboisii H88]|uniref:Uncharacterized protein n=2 Tax=Ajellomyces capsulatus TaxID=5037 RepID=F0UK80_AJEC8|nr:hypothetical protein HCDG_06665 [Histoplasma capsulatum H143]EGC46715.1 hypothetical protein HCEG_05930 [Histoplasma capsulatum var. duboisii H88]QSS57344.1 hypothetical protein I7I53_05792 [Histoplasma capsulatum var. duboisii H88]